MPRIRSRSSRSQCPRREFCGVEGASAPGLSSTTVALTAQVHPLPPPTLAPIPLVPTAPLELLGRQVNFHVDLLVDFVVTGAQLIARQVQVPGTLLQDLQNGTRLPVAVGRALQTIVEVELDAGRELVGFAAEYIDFQVRFLADLIALPFAVVAAVSRRGRFVLRSRGTGAGR